MIRQQNLHLGFCAITRRAQNKKETTTNVTIQIYGPIRFLWTAIIRKKIEPLTIFVGDHLNLYLTSIDVLFRECQLNYG